MKEKKPISKRKEEISTVQEVKRVPITFKCPTRGWVTEIVDVKVYPKVKANDAPTAEDLEEFLRQEGVIEED